MSLEHNVEFHEFRDRKGLFRRLAVRICSILSATIREKGRAVLVVSGGSTPVPLFEELSGQDLDWKKVYVTLADERWVPPSDPDSNEALVRRHLLKGKAAGAKFIGLYNGASSALEGEKACQERLGEIISRIDVLVLGMGNDGHTASLFAGAERLKEAVDMGQKRPCIAIRPGDAPHERMTLTLNTLLKARHIFLVITGEEKRRVIEKALSQGPMEEMPIRFVLAGSSVPVSIHWAP